MGRLCIALDKKGEKKNLKFLAAVSKILKILNFENYIEN